MDTFRRLGNRMGDRMRRIGAVLLVLLLSAALVGCGASAQGTGASASQGGDASASEQQGSGQDAGASDADADDADASVTWGESYTSKEEVAAYLHEYGELPPNFISKTKARQAGWVPSEGNLDEICPGMSIGGSVFYNDDGLLPDAEGRTWHECDINYHGGTRGAERIVYSTDGLIYYTADHYQTFERLY